MNDKIKEKKERLRKAQGPHSTVEVPAERSDAARDRWAVGSRAASRWGDSVTTAYLRT